MNPGWTDERVETLKKMWGDGASAGQIARYLGGVSRSAVIGKVHRLDLSGRADTPKKTPRTPKPKAPPINKLLSKLSDELREMAAAGRHPEPLRKEDGSLIGTADVTDRHCRYPHGDPGTEGFHFCGLAPRAGSRYCLLHCAKVFAPPPPKKEKRAR